MVTIHVERWGNMSREIESTKKKPNRNFGYEKYDIKNEEFSR